MDKKKHLCTHLSGEDNDQNMTGPGTDSKVSVFRVGWGLFGVVCVGFQAVRNSKKKVQQW